MALQPSYASDSTFTGHELNKSVIAGAEEVALPANADRQVFEGDLQRFATTYAIYSWLPEQDRDEVYRASMDGASMKEIRRLVISKRRTHY